MGCMNIADLLPLKTKKKRERVRGSRVEMSRLYHLRRKRKGDLRLSDEKWCSHLYA